jgi:hypothetical protein
MEHEQIWIYGETAATTTTRTVFRSFLKLKWKKQVKDVIPARAFDSRQGDTVPEKVKKAKAKWRAAGNMLNLYIYPGEKVENPTFDDIIKNLQGRDTLTKHQTLLCTISAVNGCMITVPNESVRITFDSSTDSPHVTYEYIMLHELFVFPGPWEETVTLCFRDQAQMESVQYVLNGAEELPTAVA